MKTIVCAAALALLLPLTADSGAARPHGQNSRPTELPMTGLAVPALSSYDRIVPDLMAKWEIPGAAVAVVKDGRLVLARGYGWADREARQPVQPDSLFRIASLSKSLTAAAILKLIEDGRLRLDDKAFDKIGDLAPRPGGHVNPELRKITIHHLLQHSGGWDRDTSFDPMFRSREIVRTLGTPSPADARATIRYMLDQPLQFDPGTRYAYSNFGYCVLGRVIEKTTGERYEDYVKANILRPAGVTCTRLGHTLLSERAAKEVRYYVYPGAPLGESVFPVGPRKVPWPDGAWSLEAMDAHGGWIASAIDLARFIATLDGKRPGHQVLQTASVRQMVARPAAPLWVGTDTWYGMGWQVRPAGNDANWWHAGSLDGTTTLMVRAGNGLTWVVLLNFRPNSDDLGAQLDQAMWQAANAVKQWPDHDLFDRFAGCSGE